MAFVAGKDTDAYCNGYDLTAYLKNLSPSGSAAAYDVTTFGKSAHVYVGGLTDATISAGGFFEGSVDSVDQVLQAALGATGIWLVYPAGDALGNLGRAIGGVTTKYGIDSPVDGIVAVSMEGGSNYGPLSVKSHRALASASSGTTDGTSIDNGASSANGGHGILQITAQAATSVVVKVQHSADNSTWADLITFTTVTAAPAAEILEVTGTVNRYTRFTVAATGGTVTLAVGFGRK